jgi:hypothetical protein
MATTLNVTELAARLDTTPRTARKFLRATFEKEDQPGKGGRWSIEAKQVRSLTAKFKTWQDEHTRPVAEEDDVPETDDELYEALDNA